MVKSRKQRIMKFLPYNPGLLPTRPAPRSGESLLLEVPGLPPIKTARQSIRNDGHPQHHCFVALREAAISAMAGRAWYFGAVALDLTIFGPGHIDRWSLNDYLGGIMDTLDGSSGQTFTYLPIIFEDDCQVCATHCRWLKGLESSYRLKIKFN